LKFRQHPTDGFTTKATGLRNALENQILISEVYDPAIGLPEPVKRQYVAIWDTGATNTVVTRKVAQELNLQPSGRVSVQAVGAGDQVHEYETDTYLLNIHLPNNVVIFGIRVSEGTIRGADVLLGMDIIAHGDFAITNYNGQTWWTFRVPSNEPIDFVEEIEQHKRKHGPHRISLSQEEARKEQNRRKRGRRKARGK
jgi:predicted aspartyl protease